MKSFYEKLNINEVRLLKYDLEINGMFTGWIKCVNIKKHYLKTRKKNLGEINKNENK
jgi:hypothetical protein